MSLNSAVTLLHCYNYHKMSVSDTLSGSFHVTDDAYIRSGTGNNVGAQIYNTCQYSN